MDNKSNSNQSKSNLGENIIAAIFVFVIAFLLNSCTNQELKYEKTLRDGLEKYYNGEKMTKEEHDAVESYHNWVDDQKEKKYDEWN